MKHIKLNTKLFEVILLFILSLTPLLWLRYNSIVLGHDSGFRLNPAQHLKDLFYSWDHSNIFGADWSLLKGFLIAQFPEAFFTTIFRSISLGQTAAFVLWFLLLGLSMYIFLRFFFPDSKYWILRIFGSVFYMYNFFVLQAWFIVERSKFSVLIAFPLGLLILYKTLSKQWGLFKGSVLFAFTFFFFNGGGNPTLHGFIVIAYGITVMYFILLEAKKGLNEILSIFKKVFSFLILTILVNSYWILPQVYLSLNTFNAHLESLGGLESLLGWEATVSKYASFINLFRLQGIPDWYNNIYHPYSKEFITNPILILLSFIPFFIILLGLFLYRRLNLSGFNHRLLMLIFLLFLISYLFVGGTHPPLGFIYELFVRDVPGFVIFRSSFYKFGSLYWFSFIFLASFFLNILLLSFVKKSSIRNVLGIIAIGFILIYHYPFFIRNFFVWDDSFTTKVHVPPYVFEIANYINTTNPETRILLLPSLDRGFTPDLYSWGFLSLDTLPRLFTNRSIVANGAGYPKIIDALYKVISRNDEDGFLRLADMTGIDRVLWRDDAVFENKNLNSKSFITEKENLERFNGIKKEKTFNSWTLYKIDSSARFPLFSSTNFIIYSRISSSSLPDVLKNNSIMQNPSILLESSMENKDQSMRFLSKIDVVEAMCMLCTPEDSGKRKGGIIIPSIKLLPDSPFYFIIDWKERKTFEQYKNNPIFRIDLDLGHSNKRIAEINAITKRKSKDNSITLIQQAIEKYKTLVIDAIAQAELLSEDKKNTALINIQSYVNSQYKYLSEDINVYLFSGGELEDLSLFMQEQIASLEKNSWFTDLVNSQIKYILSIEKDDYYSLSLNEIGTQPTSIAIDGSPILGSKNIYLKKGIHKLYITYPKSENFLQASESGELILPFGKKTRFTIRNFNAKNTYALGLDYRTIYGRPKGLIRYFGNGQEEIEYLNLAQNNISNFLFTILNPFPDSVSAELQFYPTGFDTNGAVLNAKNLSVFKIFTPRVFFSRTANISGSNPPHTSFEKINPTKYLVHINNATNPYLLNFGESYNSGWKVYVEGNTDSVSEQRHYSINGYANGWYIDKLGNYNILVEYYPQKIFYIGLFISMGSISGSLLLLAFLYLRRIRWAN